MPCYEPQPTERTLQAQRTAKAIVLLFTKMGLTAPTWVLQVYLADARSDLSGAANQLTEFLCTTIRGLHKSELDRHVYDGRDKDSRFIADWWQEHEAFDNQREE